METEVSEKTNVRNMSILRGTHLLVLNNRHQVHRTRISPCILVFFSAYFQIQIEKLKFFSKKKSFFVRVKHEFQHLSAVSLHSTATQLSHGRFYRFFKYIFVKNINFNKADFSSFPKLNVRLSNTSSHCLAWKAAQIWDSFLVEGHPNRAALNGNYQLLYDQ